MHDRYFRAVKIFSSSGLVAPELVKVEHKMDKLYV